VSQAYPATLSAFRLDKYEVTVARFRQFVNAVVGGLVPAAGAGKHSHLNSGQGVADSSSPGQFETGWDASWTVAKPPTGDPLNLPTTLHGWQENLDGPGGPDWSPRSPSVSWALPALPLRAFDALASPERD
jgi:formylglycine-generating enzyme required for sulfatase activity